MKVLAVDVGLKSCGYVLCEVKKLDIAVISEDEINPKPKSPLPEKLNLIFEKLKEEIRQTNPQALIVEKLYAHHRHPVTLGLLSHVRGVVALLACRYGLDFFEYSPTKARKSFLGKGRGSSEQVKKMAENITGKKFKSVHTADAYSLVVTFSHNQKFSGLIPELKREAGKKQ